jgi:uncharacterized protein
MSRFLYLHGFASSPASRKAVFFRDRLLEVGVELETPDLAAGDFERLTLSGQLALIEKAARHEPVVLIGSSMGGYLAALYAARHPEVVAVVLLAPAFNFYALWKGMLTADQLAEWKSANRLMVYHYTLGRETPLGYQLFEDAEKYEPYPSVGQPALLFHGIGDPVVPIQYSEAFAKSHGNVELVRLQSGHELTDVLPGIWERTELFLQQVASRG